MVVRWMARQARVIHRVPTLKRRMTLDKLAAAFAFAPPELEPGLS
jgi:hypothetical protein